VTNQTLQRNRMRASMCRSTVLVVALLACISCSVHAEGALQYALRSRIRLVVSGVP
jgi:hypothetical protein